MVGATINRRDMNHSERNYEIQQLETSRHEAAKAVCLSAAALDDASIIGALNHINDERAAAQERPVTLQCLADAGMGIMWEPRLVVVQDAGTSNGIDCGNVQAFEEAVWHNTRRHAFALLEHCLYVRAAIKEVHAHHDFAHCSLVVAMHGLVRAAVKSSKLAVNRSTANS